MRNSRTLVFVDLVGPSNGRQPRMAGHVAFRFAWSAFVGGEIP